MRSIYVGQINQYEWRWLILMSSIFIFLAIMPFMMIAGNSLPNPRLQFLGIVHDYPQVVYELSVMAEGMRGQFLPHFLHTSEVHTGVFLEVVYVVLGTLAKVIGLESVVLFQVSRVGAALFMYFSLYTLGATVWTNIRTRRIFFSLSAFGGGLGWMFAPWIEQNPSLDLLISNVFPYQATLVNVSYPLTIGLLALMVSALIGASRLGSEEEPSVSNQGLSVFVIGILLVLVYPVALIPLSIAFLCLMVAHSFQNRVALRHDLRWMLWFAVPSLPLYLYYVTILHYNPVAASLWFQRYSAPPPSLPLFLVSFGIPLLLAIPGLVRAVRKFEPDGNQIMLGWLVVMVALIYFTPAIQLAFGVGMMIPVAYFATRGIEDFWFRYLVTKRIRVWLFIACMPIIGMSHFSVTFAPVQAPDVKIPGTLTLDEGYLFSFIWLQQNYVPNHVVLAAPNVSAWVPAWSGMPVVYGSPNYTINPTVKRAILTQWFKETNVERCHALLDGTINSTTPTHPVAYVVYGTHERALGETVCLGLLEKVASDNGVDIYQYKP